jgi:hypothetical protein
MYRYIYIILSTFIFCAVINQSAAAQDLSDQDIKTNISPIADPLQQITSLNPKAFQYNTGKYKHLSLPSGIHYGFIAEEFRQVFPGLVHRKPYSYMVGKNLYKSATVPTINLEELIPVLIASIKQQQAEIDQLKLEMEKLKKR